ncbi:hypothetical protein JCM10296v2_006079 [Rhodotorula toruloides]
MASLLGVFFEDDDGLPETPAVKEMPTADNGIAAMFLGVLLDLDDDDKPAMCQMTCVKKPDANGNLRWHICVVASSRPVMLVSFLSYLTANWRNLHEKLLSSYNRPAFEDIVPPSFNALQVAVRASKNKTLNAHDPFAASLRITTDEDIKAKNMSRIEDAHSSTTAIFSEICRDVAQVDSTRIESLIELLPEGWYGPAESLLDPKPDL